MADKVLTDEQVAEAVRKLEALRDTDDPEVAHEDADHVLLDLIGDERVTAAFDAIDKWYA